MTNPSKVNFLEIGSPVFLAKTLTLVALLDTNLASIKLFKLITALSSNRLAIDSILIIL